MSDLIERLRLNQGEIFGPTMQEAANELERLNKCLQWEQNRAERIGTHGVDCWKWGHYHYECALREIERLERENEELRTKYDKLSKLNLAQHEMYEKDNNTLHDEIAALKAQSTEQWSHTMRQKKEWADEKDAKPFAWASKYAVQLKESGALGAEVSFVNLGWTDQIELFTTPPTAAALLGNLGNWVYEKMKQADSDYHNYGDTADVYATLKMVLSKIESMMIESLPIIEGKK